MQRYILIFFFLEFPGHRVFHFVCRRAPCSTCFSCLFQKDIKTKNATLQNLGFQRLSYQVPDSLWQRGQTNHVEGQGHTPNSGLLNNQPNLTTGGKGQVLLLLSFREHGDADYFSENQSPSTCSLHLAPGFPYLTLSWRCLDTHLGRPPPERREQECEGKYTRRLSLLQELLRGKTPWNNF